MAFPASQNSSSGGAGNPGGHQYAPAPQQRAPAAQPPPQRSATAQGGAGGGEGDGADVYDLESFREHFAPMLEQHTAPLRQQLDSYNKENEQHRRTFQRLQKAFTGEEGDGKDGKGGKKSDPKLQQYGDSLDFLLTSALKAQQQDGRGFPITAQMGSDFYEFAMDQLKRNNELTEQLAALTDQVKKQGNPRKTLWDQSMMDFDNRIRNAMSVIYGADDTYEMQRDAQWDAVSKQIFTELKDLSESEPETLDQILRSPQARERMVSHFVKLNIPPRARQILEEQRMQQTVQTTGDLEKAWVQARDIPDDRERSRVQTMIRQAWWEQRHVERFGDRGRARAGQRMLNASLFGDRGAPQQRQQQQQQAPRDQHGRFQRAY